MSETPKEPTATSTLTPTGGVIAENAWRYHEAKRILTPVSAMDDSLIIGTDRDDKDELLAMIDALILSTGEAGAREIPKP